MSRQLSKKIQTIDRLVSIEKGRRKEMKRQLKIKKQRNKDLIKDNLEIEKCIVLLSHIAKNTESKIVELFQSTVSAALKDIFDESYEFRFEFGKRGSITTCEYEVISSEFQRWNDIVMTRGKSVAQVIALVLRIILVKIDKDSPDIVVFDEPLDGLENDRKYVAGKFVSELCKQLSMQMIMVTHSDEIADYSDKKVVL